MDFASHGAATRDELAAAIALVPLEGVAAVHNVLANIAPRPPQGLAESTLRLTGMMLSTSPCRIRNGGASGDA